MLYCNGPFCGKSKRLSEQLVKLGYTHVRRYQLGLPVWRGLGNSVQTDLEGFEYVFKGDKTAVYVDARSPSEFGTRVIVFGDTAEEARRTAEEIARKAYWNSSSFGGVFAELKSAKLWWGQRIAAQTTARAFAHGQRTP